MILGAAAQAMHQPESQPGQAPDPAVPEVLQQHVSTLDRTTSPGSSMPRPDAVQAGRGMGLGTGCCGGLSAGRAVRP